MSNQHKDWLVQEQTALGKDLSNPFMVDNLPKIVWYSMHHSIYTEAWLLQSKRLAGKELSNPFIADDLLKIIWTISHSKAHSDPVIRTYKKEGVDYFNTYAPIARITTIRLFLALAAIHNLVIHQMDVKTVFLNGDLEEKVYMKQPEGFVMSGNKHKVCKLVKSLYRLKQAPKQWHQKFDEFVLSNGFLLNQSDKCVYSKFDGSGKGVIICLYVDDMLIFGTDQNQVDKTKKFLSSKFSMKDMGEADVVLGIKIKRENKGIVITQSHYIEKILKKFNRECCSPVSTLMDPVEKLMLNTGKPVDQLEYSRAIGCLMYAMTTTRPDIAYAVGRLSKFTSNPSRHHWHAITRVFKYLKGTINYGLSYVGYPSVLEGYSDASWINHVEDLSSTSGWVFMLGGCVISWASKKQTCITGSTMESEFVALVAAGKEAEWLRNLIHEIPIWPKPIAPISIHCDSAATLAKAYSQIYNGIISVVDHTRLISKYIFVTNFPDNTTSKDLWEVCKGYGTVVDAFIPDRKSRAGKRFAFVRFIKVDNVDRLPAANGASSFASVLKGNPNNFNHIASSPAMVLDDECVVERDLDNFVMGEVKDFLQLSIYALFYHMKGFQHARQISRFGIQSIPFPPGFTPEREFQHVDAPEVQGMENSLSKRRSEGLSSRVLEDAQPLNEHASPSIDSKKKQVARYWRNQSGRLVISVQAWVIIDKVIDQGGVNDDILLSRCKLNYTFPNRLSSDQLDMLESPISRDEVRNAVWGCGENKSPGPDGFTFEFFQKFWETFGSDFLSLLQILDGPFIINELLSWCKHKKQQAMVFKVDFAKACDLIRWNFLEDVRRAFGFGSKWCSWIRGCLHSGTASVLLNGSPTAIEAGFLRASKLVVGLISSQLALLQTYIEGTLLSNMEDRWVWDLNGEGVFRVKDVRILLDECFLPKAPTATRWVKYVPIKINVFAWKVFLDRKIPCTCSSVADWLRISSCSYAAGGIYHGRPLVHMLIGLIGSIPSN
ncbi:zinc finger, CCHC-type containing protein [Tanacetum coccineum]